MKTTKLQAEETTKRVISAKSANNSVNAEVMEKENDVLTPRKVLKRFLWLHSEEVAKKCVARSNYDYGYDWDEAKEATKEFTRIYTTSEADKDKGIFAYQIINGTAYSYKLQDESEITADSLLASFESYKMIHTSLRREANREAKRVQKEEKIV